MSNKFTTGTVSHGTLRFVDLAPAFIDFLAAYKPAEAAVFGKELEAILAKPEEERFDDDVVLLDDVSDAINAILPPYLYFGAIEGDGSDYGIWFHEVVGEDAAEALALADRTDDPEVEAFALRSAVNALVRELQDY